MTADVWTCLLLQFCSIQLLFDNYYYYHFCLIGIFIWRSLQIIIIIIIKRVLLKCR